MATDFDTLLNRYRNISYGRLGLNNPSSVNNLSSLLDDIQQVEQTEYFRTIPAEEQTFVSGVPQNQWSYGEQDGRPTGLIFGTPDYGLLGGGDAGGAWPTYDPTIDYGEPGYAGVIPGEGGLLDQVIPIQAQFGGEGEGRARAGFGMGPIGHQNQAAYSMNEDGTFNMRTWDGNDYNYDKDAEADENGMIDAQQHMPEDEYGRRRYRDVKIKKPSQTFTNLAEDAKNAKKSWSDFWGNLFGKKEKDEPSWVGPRNYFNPSQNIGLPDPDAYSDRPPGLQGDWGGDPDPGPATSGSFSDAALGKDQPGLGPQNGGGQGDGPGPGGPTGGPGHAGGHHF